MTAKEIALAGLIATAMAMIIIMAAIHGKPEIHF